MRAAPLSLAVALSLAASTLHNSRASAFVNAGFNVAVVRLVAEGGYLGGKDQKLTTDFEGFDTTKGKSLAGLGLRVGF
jgi:hypothetical protein